MIQAFMFLAIGVKILSWCWDLLLKGNSLAGISMLILFPFIFGKFIVYIGYRADMLNERTTKMKWKMIKNIYKINPNKWNYDYYRGDYKHLVYCDSITIILSFLAYQCLLFHSWKNRYIKRKIYRNENLKQVLESAQKDIDIKRSEINICQTTMTMDGFEIN